MDEHKGNIFASLFIIANRLQALGDRLDPAVTVKQWLLIAIIYKSSPNIRSAKELAGITGVSHQNVMQMARNLERKGFLEITMDPSDRRIKRIGLTRKCLAYFAARGDRELAFLNDLFADFSGEALAQFSTMIQQLISNIVKMEERISS